MYYFGKSLKGPSLFLEGMRRKISEDLIKEGGNFILDLLSKLLSVLVKIILIGFVTLLFCFCSLFLRRVKREVHHCLVIVL